MKKKYLIWLVSGVPAVVVILTLAIVGISGDEGTKPAAGGGAPELKSDASRPRQPQQRASKKTTQAIPSTALGQMAIAFEGQPNKERIKQQLDTAMRMYSVPITGENYSRAGSVLVALSNEYGPTEMDILDYMIRSHVPGVSITFPNAAGLSVAFLSAGDR